MVNWIFIYWSQGKYDVDIKDYLESREIPDSVDTKEYAVDDGSFNAVPAVQSAADKLGIPFEECADSVYRPYCITKFIYENLLNRLYDGLDYGERVEYNGDNELEYEAYVLKTMKINIKYLDTLFEQAEIVERNTTISG